MTDTLTTGGGAGLLPLGDAVALGPTGLSFNGYLSFEEWEGVGRMLRSIGEALQWAWGDWLNYGQRTYGETYAQCSDLAGVEVKTLQNWRYVAEAVQPARRKEDLTFTHHAAVASLPPAEQDAALTWAAETGASVRDLRVHTGGGDPDDWTTCPTCGSRVHTSALGEGA